MLIVQKYGGTSVGSVERIQSVAKRIDRTVKEGNQCVIVVSAMGSTTDELVKMARQISTHPSEREMDMLLATGEQVSIALLSMALQELSCNTLSMTGWQAGIKTENVHGRAKIQEIDAASIRREVDQGKVVIVAGFQGVSKQKEITTLGRGGSDTTAVALAAALGADLCEIYTDVKGVYTADPRIVPSARKLSSISYDEMLEMATLGAVVLHPRAVECAKLYRVPLTVRHSFSEEEGTMIQEMPHLEQGLVVTGVAHEKDVVRAQVQGLPNQVGQIARLFALLAEENVNVDVIVQSEYGTERANLSFTMTEEDQECAESVLNAHQAELDFQTVAFESGLAKVSIVGAGMITNPGVAASCFQYLAEAGIPVKMISTSEIKISCIIPRSHMEAAVNKLHQSFGLDA